MEDPGGRMKEESRARGELGPEIPRGTTQKPLCYVRVFVFRVGDEGTEKPAIQREWGCFSWRTSGGLSQEDGKSFFGREEVRV